MQDSGEPGWHWPSSQVSLTVQAEPSSQDAPSFGMQRHAPVVGSHDGLVQGFGQSQSMYPVAMQEPCRHTLVVLQGSSSTHTEPSGLGVVTHPPGSWQVLFVQALPSSQDNGSPVQRPLSQRSLTVQALLSEQLPLRGTKTQPPA